MLSIHRAKVSMFVIILLKRNFHEKSFPSSWGRKDNITNTSARVLLFILTENSSLPQQKGKIAYFGATTENAREKHETHIGMKKKKSYLLLSLLPNNENSVVSELNARNKNWNVDCGWKPKRERERQRGRTASSGKCRANRMKISIGVGRKNPEKDIDRGGKRVLFKFPSRLAAAAACTLEWKHKISGFVIMLIIPLAILADCCRCWKSK